mmetsp:Transcript_40798/g.122908  ORF Transcript_40798/g.122908 Transcript_40798/m.122908 type:complete len:258 (-) Transcript_40798:85-858(-)
MSFGTTIFFTCHAHDLQHALDELVNLLSTVTSLTALQEVQKLGLFAEATIRRRQLKRPEEVICLLEVGSDSDNLMNKVSTALNTSAIETLINDTVVGDGDALLVDLSEATLVNKLLNGGTSGVSIGNIRLDETEHADGGLVHADKGRIVNLAKTEELHNLLGLGRDTDDTANTDNERQLRLGRHVEATSGLCLTTVSDSLLVRSFVLSLILSGGLQCVLLIRLLLLLGCLGRFQRHLGELGLSGLLLENGFRSLHRC